MFSDGGFRPVKPRKSTKGQTACKGGEKNNPAKDQGGDNDNDLDDDASGIEAEGVDKCELFACPNEGCVKTYQRYGSMINHTLYGQCVIQPERESLLDTAKMLYSKKLLADNNVLIATTETAAVFSPSSPNSILDTGWALKLTKKSKPFSEKQKGFLEEKFTIGETTGRKLDPVTVARQMRVARSSDGQRQFTTEELLPATQIRGYFSRRAKSKNQATVQAEIRGYFSRRAKSKNQATVQAEEDFVAAQVEDAMESVRNEVIEQTQPDHPLTYDGYDLCDLVARKKLSKLTVPVLQDICCKFELDVSSKGQKVPRRKAPYIEILEKHVRSCSCFDKLPAN